MSLPTTFQPFPFQFSGYPSPDNHNLAVKALIEFELKNGHDSVPPFSRMHHPRQCAHFQLTLNTQSPTLFLTEEGEAMPNRPTTPAKEITGNSGVFTDFMRRLVKVPHSEIKAKLEAEKAAKRTRTKRSASRAFASSPKRAT